VHTSGICRGTLAPKWRERVRLPVRDAAAGEMRVRLVDADPLRSYGGALGGAEVPLLQLCDGARHAMQLRLRGPGGGGMMRVALRFTPSAQPAAAPAGPEDASDSEADEEPPLPPAGAFEPLCEITHAGTATQATLWRASAARVLVLAFRGTSELRDWLTNLECVRMRAGEENESHVGLVHAGFMRAYDSVRRRVLTALVDARRVAPGQSWRVVVTGHSLGGALATLCAAELAELHAGSGSSGKGGGSGADVRVSLCTFGSPRVGDAAFAARCDAFLGAASVRVVNDEDIVPLVPPLGFRHVGSAVRLACATASPLALPGANQVFAALLRGAAIDNHYVEQYVESLERVIITQGGDDISRPAQEEEEHASETSSDTLGEQL
jgi:pimeloyl-ACP methyl ester carboxylesterase